MSEQVAVITGAGSGIGKAIALALAAKNATLALVGRRRAPLEAVADSARERGAKAALYETDLGIPAAIDDLTQKLRKDVGGLNILVHSAAIIQRGLISAAPAEDFDRHYYTNVRAPYCLTQALLPLMRDREGQIVFINSSVAFGAKAEVSQYGASKHALKALADSLRQEVNSQGIRVLSVYPGRTASPTQERLHAEERRAYQPSRLLQPADVAEIVLSALMLPRTAEVTDIQIRPMLSP